MATDRRVRQSRTRALNVPLPRPATERPSPPLGQATEACPYEWFTSWPYPKADGCRLRRVRASVPAGGCAADSLPQGLPAPCPDVTLATTFPARHLRSPLDLLSALAGGAQDPRARDKPDADRANDQTEQRVDWMPRHHRARQSADPLTDPDQPNQNQQSAKDSLYPDQRSPPTTYLHFTLMYVYRRGLDESPLRPVLLELQRVSHQLKHDLSGAGSGRGCRAGTRAR